VDIVFVHTRYEYDSYTDFWKLVELSGFDTCYVDEVMVTKTKVYIVSPMNGEWTPHISSQTGSPHNAHLIHWNLERPSGSGSVYEYARSNRDYMYNRLIDDVWVSDRRLSHETLFRFVVLGADYGLGEPGVSKTYDVVHMSYVSHRRSRVYDALPGSVAPNRWPWTGRDTVLKASKFALNIHKDDYPFQEPLRLALFAAYGLPILTESMADAYPWNENICVFNEYDGIAGRLAQMLKNDYTRWRDMGLLARDYMCDKFNFRKMVLKGVDASLEAR